MSSRSKARTICLQENAVIVRVWTSQFNKRHRGENVGHVSIETVSPPGYMSLWPSEAGKASNMGFFQPIQHEFKPDYDADYEAEGRRKPEVTVVLYNLNPGKIYAEFQNVVDHFESLKEVGKSSGWVLIGGNQLINGKSGESCSSLAWRLLKAGGIYDEISSSYSSTNSVVVSPDGLVNVLKSAKVYEQESYPDTKEFQFSGELSVPERRGGCTLI